MMRNVCKKSLAGRFVRECERALSRRALPFDSLTASVLLCRSQPKVFSYPLHESPSRSPAPPLCFTELTRPLATMPTPPQANLCKSVNAH